MAHRDVQPGPGGQSRQPGLPCPGPVSVGSAGIGGDQQPGRAGVAGPARCLPPAADRLDRERRGVAVGAHAHPAGVRGHVIHPVRDGLAGFLVGEVMVAHPDRTAPGLPLRSAIREVADLLLLLGIDADHRLPGCPDRPGPAAPAAAPGPRQPPACGPRLAAAPGPAAPRRSPARPRPAPPSPPGPRPPAPPAGSRNDPAPAPRPPAAGAADVHPGAETAPRASPPATPRTPPQLAYHNNDSHNTKLRINHLRALRPQPRPLVPRLR